MEIFEETTAVEYQCFYCNASFSEQFVVCRRCNKERKDITRDRYITNTALVAGIAFILVAIYIEWQYISFIFDPASTTGYNRTFLVSILMIILGIAGCTISCIYYFRMRNKKDFYYLE